MIPWLSSIDTFPPLAKALGPDSDAPGLLAASADLTPQRLLAAYRCGIFPWYSSGQPVLWWSPDPRMVLQPSALKVSTTFRKTLKRVLRDDAWSIRVDGDFRAVMAACAAFPREGQSGTWITPQVIDAYCALHEAGFAHSVETWFEGRRVGGLYGVSIGSMFFGESMFADISDASKIALACACAHLSNHGVDMIDCQQNTAHLARLGGREIARHDFIAHLKAAVDGSPISWTFDKFALQHWLTS